MFKYEAVPHILWPHIRECEPGESGANFTSFTNRQYNQYETHSVYMV